MDISNYSKNQGPIKAQRETVKFCEGVEVDGYMLPDGEFRVGKSGAAIAVGYGKAYLTELESKSPKQLKALQDKGYTGEIIVIEVDSINGGGKYIQSISESDFNALVLHAASKGKRTAMRILAKTEKIESVKPLENTARRKIKNNIQIEKAVQDKLEKKLNACKEVKTPAGFIDLLTDTELIEIKEWKRWKEAVGQVICYSKYYPSHQKRIHFFGKVCDDLILLVKIHCEDQNIIVTWENGV